MPWNFGGNPDNPNYFEQGSPVYGGEIMPYQIPEGEDPFGNIAQGMGGGSGEYGGVNVPGEEIISAAQGGGGGGFNISDPSTWGAFLQGLPKDILNLMPGSDGKSIAAGLMIPSWLSAYKQWEDSGKYGEVAKEAAKYGDPFGQANREYYQQQLKKSYEDPAAFLNDPGHQAKLKSGLDQVSRQDAMKGYLGSGNMAADLSAYTTNLNNQFLDQERARLQPLTGAQFNPAAAGEFLMRGNEQEINSQNAALQALMYPFMMNAGENHINNNTTNGSGGNGQPGGGNGGGGSGDGGSYGTKTPQNTSSAGNLVNAVTSGNKAAIDAAISQGIQWVRMPDGTMANLYAMAQSGYRTGEPDGLEYPTGSHGMPITESDPIQEGLQGGRNPDDPEYFYPTPPSTDYLPDVVDEVPDWNSDEAWNFDGIDNPGYFDP